MKHKVTAASSDDLACILAWLEKEGMEDGEGFWCNREVVQECYADGELNVIRVGGKAVAFLASNAILNVRKDMQRRGLGTALVRNWIAEATRDGLTVLDVQCAPHSSLAFWQRQGFEHYGVSPHGDRNPLARFLIQRTYVLPAELPRVEVTISF